ncbi:hypothetical protein LEP1GSC047_0286 [Leptospira inadai serovar Lyme str. 10]|uniref:Uncharacterized protein n=1 Tax=Leptospira inadai serovar Lyme str. 10 TaxID=1049790 RepID=V6HA20_9LEPT|nr:hypothetical protein LEP1GSC047_0286 [Leptospira inadai serovar Lyme str. 10]
MSTLYVNLYLFFPNFFFLESEKPPNKLYYISMERSKSEFSKPEMTPIQTMNFIFRKRALLILFGLFCIILSIVWFANNAFFFAPTPGKRTLTRAIAFSQAEKSGRKGVLFLAQAPNCLGCKEASTSLQTLQSFGWEFLEIDSESPDYEQLLSDDRFADKLTSLQKRKPVWGAWNLGEELIYLGEGSPTEELLDTLKGWGNTVNGEEPKRE